MKTDFILKSRMLGDILVQQGRLTPEQLIMFLRVQKKTRKPIGRILIEQGILTEEELKDILGKQFGIPHTWLRKGLIDPWIVNILPKEKALRFQVIPMFRVNNVLTLATADPNAIFVFDEVSRITELEVQPVICRSSDIIEAIHEYYREEVTIDEVMSGINESDIEVVEAATDKEIDELAEMAEGSPIINLTNKILLRAIRDRASDIHIEPQKLLCQVRVRIDGLLYKFMSLKMEMHPPVVSRLKIMANLDIAERRIPQDGRIQVNVDGRTIDLRFSSMPSIHGEKVVLRILDKNKALLDINKLGFDTKILNQFKSVLKKPYGLILVCGPTGCGKTTTLYSAITTLNSSEKNIITIEDPVEYQLDNITQSQVKELIGLTFARFLKHALRQDPDIILVGEIRDRETAEIAIQASLTGHLVISTLHTNDSPSAITRLLEMGIEPYLLSSSLLACQAQRLVRTICSECKTGYYPPQEVLRKLGIDDEKFMLYKGKGCSACYDSGFKGRIGIYEFLEIDEGIQSLILNNPTIDILLKYLKTKKHRRLKDLGDEKVRQGVTTIEEVRRVTSAEM
ncbi:MAG: Flp pilus assembly complex ATPase component TadA [Desulfobacterales bacterium]|nr:Flp pilus assembly complex ATPase component TadA [Desulfobacterales bacterium]